jgi:hypothetical protein
VLTAILLVIGSAVLLRTAVPAAIAGDGAALWWLLGAGMCLVTAAGLFKYKNWARRLMIVIGVWGGIDWALFTIAGWWIWSHELPPFVLGLMVLGAPVLIGIAIWFATRRRDFR